jgi:hypothetical protein
VSITVHYTIPYNVCNLDLPFLSLWSQTGFWEVDYAYLKGIEGPIVDGVGLGYPGFFALPGQVC